MRTRTPHLLLTAIVLWAGAPARAQTQLELGKMWTFENPPLAYLEKEYGFKPGPEWLDALRLASLRFGDWCSASFVSPQGLIMTNHHCVRDNIAKAMPKDQDWVKDGYYAGSLEDEVPLEGLTVQQLVAMRDVTARMLSGLDGLDDEAAEHKRSDNEDAIKQEAEKENPGLTAQVVSLHQGANYQLYLYKVYDDIRLVCAPHLQTAYFGGDPDNFTYPRYCIDFAFCRAYENGKPADTKANYFKWSKQGVKSGDLVFVTGNPGETGRLLTVAQMEYLRDAFHPIVIEMIRHRLQILKRFVQAIPAIEKHLRPAILGDENSLKALSGYQKGLLDPKLMKRKRELEASVRERIDADPETKAKFGRVWDRLAEISEERTELEPKLRFQTPSYCDHLDVAVAICRAVDPTASTEEREAARKTATENSPRSDPLRQSLFLDHLARASHWLPKDDPYLKAVVGDDDLRSVPLRLARSKVSDPDFVKSLLDGGAETVAASEDPAIVTARAIAPLIAKNAKRNEELLAEEASQARLVGQALFACFGNKISPDATMTLRFSDGRVEGYPYNGTKAPYRTTFYGLYARNNDFDNKEPFNLPDIWLERKDRIQMNKPVDFVSTNDIIGGNSGSPVVNRDLEVVGLIFDGNIEQLPNKFLFRDDVERSVSVHVDAIIEALSKIYGAKRVVQELTGS